MSDTPNDSGDRGDARPGAARLIHPVDAGLATLILALVAWLYYQTTQFEEVSSMFTQNIPPTLFPRILLVIIALFTLMMPFEHLLLAYKGKDIDKDRREPIKPLAWISMAVLVAIMAAADYLGTQLTMFAVCFVIPILWGERRLRVVVPFAVIFPLCVGLLFNVALGVSFEPGLFGITLN